MTEINQNASLYDRAVNYWQSLGDYQYAVWIGVLVTSIALIIIVITLRNSRARSIELEDELSMEKEQMEQAQKMIDQNIKSIRNFFITYFIVGLILVRILETASYGYNKDLDSIAKAAYTEHFLQIERRATLDANLGKIKVNKVEGVAGTRYAIYEYTLNEKYKAASFVKEFKTINNGVQSMPKKPVGQSYADYLIENRHLYSQAIDKILAEKQTEAKNSYARHLYDDKHNHAQGRAELKQFKTNLNTAIVAIDKENTYDNLSEKDKKLVDSLSKIYNPGVIDQAKADKVELADQATGIRSIYSWPDLGMNGLRDIVGVVFFMPVGAERVLEFIWSLMLHELTTELPELTTEAK